MKKIIVFVLCLVMLIPAIAITSNLDYADAAPAYLDGEYSDFKFVAETDTLVLYLNETNLNIAVVNKETDYIWSTMVTVEEYPELETASDRRKLRLSPLFNISVASTVGFSTTISLKAVLETDPCNFDIDYTLENGFTVTVNYPSYEMTFKVNIWIDDEDEGLGFSFDTMNLQESLSSNIILTAIAPFPFMGASNDYTDGYIFYPDGSGAISEFTPIHTQNEVAKVFDVYTQQKVSINSYVQNERDNIMPTLYPVYGIKRGDNAMFGVATSMAESVQITYAPSGYTFNLARAYILFQLRQVCEYVREGGLSQEMFDPNFNEGVYAAKIYFLSGDKANYIGMASKYREYLLGRDMLNDSVNAGDKIPVAIDFIMGAVEERVISDKYIKMTTFPQASQIVEDLKNKGVQDLLINFSAWQKGADEYNKVIPVPRKLGGKSGLVNFIESLEGLNAETYMQVNMIYAKRSTTRFRRQSQALRDYSNKFVVNSTGDIYLVSPLAVLDRYENVYARYFENTGISGFNFQYIGYHVYHNYARSNRISRTTTIELWQSTLAQAKEDFGNTAVWYGNEYTLKTADWIYDLPISNTGYFISTESVPFAQALLHGYVSYSGIPGNLHYDAETQMLKWIEYGYVPYYKLTYESASNLMFTENNDMFSCQYTEWNHRIADIYNEFNTQFGDTYSETIVGHEKVAYNVYKTVYSNGVEIYVNYNRYDTYADGVRLAALSYKVVR
ncbi:MAG: hypothetical protein E7315_02085 [Clostridiales bacterium]|nr:hypothetical protein [Clostridiales bacterium]